MNLAIIFKKTCFVAFLCLAFSISAVTVTFGATYSVAPMVIDRELEKRDIISEKITLKNTSDRAVRIFPTVNEVSVDAGGTVQTFVEPSMIADRGASVTTWIEISRGRIELAPGETKEIPITIKVNPEVSAGEYHAFIGFPEGSNRPEAEKVVYNGSAPGTIVRIGVDKVESQFLRLTNFTVERFIKSAQEGIARFTLTNPGGDAVIPEGEIIIYDNRGNEVASVTINKDKNSVNAHEEFTFTEGIPQLSIGKYKAFLSVEYGLVQKSTLNDTAFFYVLPLKHLIIIFVTILLCAVLLALYIHRRFDRSVEVHDGVHDVGLYIRASSSAPKDHDIDLSKKKNENL